MKVLVADDSVSVREALGRLLRGAGHQVIETSDGAEAITALFAEHPDMVLLDLRMPRVTGWVVCRIIKEDPTLQRTPVLVLTALDAAEDRYWAERSGADGVIGKEEIGAGLMERIQAVAASRALSELSRIAGPVSPGDDEDVLAHVCEVLDRKLFEATVANDITCIGVRSLDLRESLDETLAALRRLVAYDVGAIGMLTERLVVVRAERSSDADALEAFQNQVVRHLGEICGADLTPGDLTTSATSGAGVRSTGPCHEWNDWHVAPLQARGRMVGALVLAAEDGSLFDERAQRTLRAVIAAVSAVADGARRFQQIIAGEVETSLSVL